MDARLAKLVPGDFFGEISLLDGGERTASVVSETPMALLELKQRTFMKMLERQPDVALKMMQGLATRAPRDGASTRRVIWRNARRTPPTGLAG